MTGAEMIVQVLADEGVDTIFGYSGGAILPTYDAVFRYNEDQRDDGSGTPMPLIVPANEQGAGFMAAGYARASGRVGVCMVTSGPGATNTVTPVRDCMADSIPIVVICGQVPTAAIGTRRVPGSARVRTSWARWPSTCFLVTDPERARGDGAHGLRDRAHRPARPGRHRRPEGRAELAGRVPGRRARCRCRGYRQRMRAVATERRRRHELRTHFFAMLGESQAAADLRRRRRHQRQRGATQLRAFAQSFGIPWSPR